MEGFTIEVQPRECSGTKECKRSRKLGLLPSVVYSHGEKSLLVSVSEREFTKVAKVAKSSQLFTLKSSDKELDGKVAIVKEIQIDHLTSKVLHVDFQSLKEDEDVTVHVALKFTGEARGVKLDGGILTILCHDVRVRCLPRMIPSEIPVDVSSLGVGNSLKIKDLTTPAGVKIEGNPDEAVVSVVTIHVVEEAAPAAVPAEGAAAAPAEGEAAASAEGAKAPEAGDKKKAESGEKKKEAKAAS